MCFFLRTLYFLLLFCCIVCYGYHRTFYCFYFEQIWTETSVNFTFYLLFSAFVKHRRNFFKTGFERLAGRGWIPDYFCDAFINDFDEPFCSWPVWHDFSVLDAMLFQIIFEFFSTERRAIVWMDLLWCYKGWPYVF